VLFLWASAAASVTPRPTETGWPTEMATNTKKPQDHKPTKAEVTEAKQQDFNEIEGSELLVPFSKVKGSDQARLVNQLKKLGVFSDDEDADGSVSVDSLDLEAVADLIDYVSE